MCLTFHKLVVYTTKVPEMHTKWKLFTKCHHQDLGTYSKLSCLRQDLKVVYVCISYSIAKNSLGHLLARVKTQIQMCLAGLDIHSTQLKIFNCNKPTDLKQQKMENSLCRWFTILRILYFQKIVRNEISKTHTLVGTHSCIFKNENSIWRTYYIWGWLDEQHTLQYSGT